MSDHEAALPPAPRKSMITEELILRAQDGDDRALEALLSRYIPRLVSWASGRLPHNARSTKETTDLVQEVVVRTLQRFDRIDASKQGGLQSYLRRGIINAIRNEIDRARRRPASAPLDEACADSGPSPLEQAIGKETISRFETALEHLRPTDRELVIARIEFGLSYEEIADLCHKSSTDAARMAVGRAVKRLAEIM